MEQELVERKVTPRWSFSAAGGAKCVGVVWDIRKYRSKGQGHYGCESFRGQEPLKVESGGPRPSREERRGHRRT